MTQVYIPMANCGTCGYAMEAVRAGEGPHWTMMIRCVNKDCAEYGKYYGLPRVAVQPIKVTVKGK